MDFDEVKVFSDCRIVAEGPPRDVLGDRPLKRFIELTGYVAPAEELEWLR
ncbi:hypothetical protein ACFSSC_08305 [Corynebacterium mendelii]|uniref:Uncharacterized protein n=1 Tax=Corynebacterium mendelii TaxID=2765362 RepID=A0A939E0G2_9CORY|nr:hypothetical protein [Corynebacterium mendelii]MBN9644665.1 hypothetical protein [Corynebacterium mendelii]